MIEQLENKQVMARLLYKHLKFKGPACVKKLMEYDIIKNNCTKATVRNWYSAARRYVFDDTFNRNTPLLSKDFRKTLDWCKKNHFAMLTPHISDDAGNYKKKKYRDKNRAVVSATISEKEPNPVGLDLKPLIELAEMYKGSSEYMEGVVDVLHALSDGAQADLAYKIAKKVITSGSDEQDANECLKNICIVGTLLKGIYK